MWHEINILHLAPGTSAASWQLLDIFLTGFKGVIGGLLMPKSLFWNKQTSLKASKEREAAVLRGN